MNKNKLMKICRVQEVTFGLQQRGFTKEHIYSNFIFPVYFISRRTYDKYMAENAERILQEQYNTDWAEVREEHVPLSYEDMLRKLAKRGMGDSLFATAPVDPTTLDWHIKNGCKR